MCIQQPNQLTQPGFLQDGPQTQPAQPNAMIQQTSLHGSPLTTPSLDMDSAHTLIKPNPTHAHNPPSLSYVQPILSPLHELTRFSPNQARTRTQPGPNPNKRCPHPAHSLIEPNLKSICWKSHRQSYPLKSLMVLHMEAALTVGSSQRTAIERGGLYSVLVVLAMGTRGRRGGRGRGLRGASVRQPRGNSKRKERGLVGGLGEKRLKLAAGEFRTNL
ncbi:hypothetical protein Salat_1739100 [Sesamum alatum]|uniref:Uncharacterized protein n=1 Tax=Sesamum alatum TaxID=300844 RepID=A0AAE2CKF7_9LAMI|nr:hypothetical protein Salat_1739100 [Sesamum alatum]